MQEVGIDITGHYSKSYEDLSPDFIATLDFVTYLCAEEVCPTIVSRAKKIHWILPDPATKEGTEEEQLKRFIDTRDTLTNRIKEFAVECTDMPAKK